MMKKKTSFYSDRTQFRVVMLNLNCGIKLDETNELNYELNNTNHQLKESRTIYVSLTTKESLIIDLIENQSSITQKQLAIETGFSVSSIKRI